MKLIHKKICRSNEGVSEVIGGLMLIMIVATFMTSLIWISTAYIDMQKNVVNSNIEACQRFIDYLNDLFPPTTPGNTPPAIKDPNPADGQTGVPLRPMCSVMACDEDGDKLAVKFFFRILTADSVETASAWKPHDELFLVDSNSTVYCMFDEVTDTDTKYYWQVTVSDGTSTITSDIYDFTTIAVGSHPGNEQPQIIEPIWPDEYEKDVPLFPTCYVTVSDKDNTDLTVLFYFNTGTFYAFVDSVDVVLNVADPPTARAECRLTGASSSGTTYDWIAIVTDGTNVVSGGPYYFTTVFADPSSP